jgi:hypothetical protein
MLLVSNFKKIFKINFLVFMNCFDVNIKNKLNILKKFKKIKKNSVEKGDNLTCDRPRRGLS